MVGLLAILHAGQEITVVHVREVLAVGNGGREEPRDLPTASSLDAPLSETLDQYERMLITRALSVAGGNVADAARRLHTDRPNLYRRMKRLGIIA